MCGIRHVISVGFIHCVALAALAVVDLNARQPQETPAVAHARRIFDLIKAEKFEDVAKEFTPQMAAALSASQLREVWSTLGSRSARSSPSSISG
jgi:hypothetical protein